MTTEHDRHPRGMGMAEEEDVKRREDDRIEAESEESGGGECHSGCPRHSSPVTRGTILVPGPVWWVVDLVFFFSRAFSIESSRFAPPSPWLGLTFPPEY